MRGLAPPNYTSHGWNQLLQTLAACRRVIGTGFQLQRLQGLPARVQVCITWLPQPPFHAAEFFPITPDTVLLSDRVTHPDISLELKLTGSLMAVAFGFTTATTAEDLLDAYFQNPGPLVTPRFYHALVMLTHIPNGAQ